METIKDKADVCGAMPTWLPELTISANKNPPVEKIEFALSASAENNLRNSLPQFVAAAAKRGRVTILSYCGGSRVEKNGKVLWEYTGPQFLLAGQKADTLCGGNFYNLLGFPVWVEELEERLLRGRVLTTIQTGHPELAELLVLENAPENYLELAFPEGARGVTATAGQK